MVSGPDIITYIGVPLAVLGVLPIIYNTVITLATLAKVRHILRHGRLAGITRGDVINHVIEVELPRYTIAPLHREEHKSEYWGLCDYPSHIPGGSWTIFNWKCHTIGLKTQRIDYADQLRQPQAEIGFEELVSFLLDLGAVPDSIGFRMLRASGLWVPTGTALLVSPDKHESVLTVAPLDDSDGSLSLAVKWSSSWSMRNPASLPPYWVLIRGEAPNSTVTKPDTTEKKPVEEDNGGKDFEETKLPKTTKYIPKTDEAPPAIRCQIGTAGLIAAIPDDSEPDLFGQLNIRHLEVNPNLPNTTGTWFASAITALGTTSSTILWNYKIPSPLLTFSQTPSIPCGILVLLSIVPESSTPEWATKYNDDDGAEQERQFRKFREDGWARDRERLMSPAERRAAETARHMKDHEDWVEGLNAARRRETQRAETRMLEALQSPVWDNRLVGEHNLTWLKKEGHVDETHDLKRVVDILLWRMVTDAGFAGDLGNMLDAWMAFVSNGGMKKADYLALKEKQVLFAYASLLLSIINDSVTAANGSLAMDLQECMRIWKKVRLG
jgi:hypothetical protein